MDITLFISRFLYRIRYKLIFGSAVVTTLVIYFSAYLPKKYTVSTTIYTGIASSNGLNDSEKPSYLELNNSFDNLIQLTKAKGTLEKVSMQLLALSLMHGNPESDNMYILADSYRNLSVPSDIQNLVAKDSLDKTVDNLLHYKQDIPTNYLFNLFNKEGGHYSHQALEKIEVRRIANSDLIRISYESDDPGIALNTVKLVKAELIEKYHSLRYTDAEDVVGYFEGQLRDLRVKLSLYEDRIMQYNIDHRVINFSEQTKAIAVAFTAYEDRYEKALREYESAQKAIANLEQHMDMRADLLKTNKKFLKMLDSLSVINGKITEIEIFSTDSTAHLGGALDNYRTKLNGTQKHINDLTDEMNQYRYSKEGVAIENMVAMWVEESIRATKAKAELEVLAQRRDEFDEKYRLFSPVGAEIKRLEREIALAEKDFAEALHGLNLAKLKMKNIQLTTASLSTVSPPTFPVNPSGGKRSLLVIGAFIGSILFIIGYYLLIELMDRTLRDAERTRRLTGMKVLGAFAGNYHLQYRGYIKECHRISARYACNKLDLFAQSGCPLIINMLSVERGEGKTFISKYLKETWEDRGMKVAYYQAGKDFSIQKEYVQATYIQQLVTLPADVDVVIIEHPAMQYAPISKSILASGNVNLLIANACRVWSYSDEEHLKYVESILLGKPLYIYLNNAEREAVEDFTGQLPPKTSIRSFANKMTYMGITAKNASVK